MPQERTVILVPTTHWDREWYRTFQAFRARLVDTLDIVLDLLESDPGYRFLLDGQTVVCEDYVELRPGRADDLRRAIADGRVAIGPWYVQPDSLLPSGESHVRNLLEGRRTGAAFGPVSRVAYTPDSFGHPAQFPQLFAGFGIGAFVYWRGNGNEYDELPSEYAWRAPDGSEVIACHLARGYFNAAGMPADLDEAIDGLARTTTKLTERTRNDAVLLLAGSDHELPERRTAELAEGLAGTTGATVTRGLLEDFTSRIPTPDASFTGELVGGRIANLLPGVWSTRTWIKLRNRACEAALTGWAEPWAAIAHRLGAPDERPALRHAWRELLQNQAHDSICGCSQDAVHEQMRARYDAARELANETTLRALERIAGLGAERRTPWTDEIDIAVFNPSPHSRTDIVRFPLEPYPPFVPSAGGETAHRIHPLLMRNLRPRGFEVDGRPARLVASEGTGRVRLIPDQQDWEVEFVATDIPAFGYRTFHIRPTEAEHPDEMDDGHEISAGYLSVSVSDDGTFTVRFGDEAFAGLGSLEVVGDRGDTYDHDPVTGYIDGQRPEPPALPRIRRRRHENGIEELEVHRRLLVPKLTEDRSHLTAPFCAVDVILTARVAPGTGRVDLRVRVDNQATDHRLRILFPTGTPTERFRAATTFDVCERTTDHPDDDRWRHPAPATFCHQGWVSANGLTVAAPGLPEAEVTTDGTIAITLLRAVGWLSRMDLATRPDPAGPGLPTPGAQCPGPLDACLVLFGSADPGAVQDAELGLRAVAAGSDPLAGEARPLVSLEPSQLVLSALKPAEDGEGIVVRVLNPTGDELEAQLSFGFDVQGAEATRLDEEPSGDPLRVDDDVVAFDVPGHALRSVRVG